MVCIARHEALAHCPQIDVLIVRVGDRECLLNTKADRVPRYLLPSFRDPKRVNCKRAHFLQRDHLEVIADQPEGNS
jgi:hypothetical protein